MNTYKKYCPNVFIAQCTEKHEKGETIQLLTKYGKEHGCIVFNLIYEKNGFFFYSIVRADGFNIQEWAKRKADKFEAWSEKATTESNSAYEKSHEILKHIPPGQPILVGHHSEKRHRRDLDKSWNAMGKSIELQEKAESHQSKAEYWQRRAQDINLSMPESIEYYEYELEEAIKLHTGLKDGSIKREHSYSLQYANKNVNEIREKFELAKKLWGEN